VDGHDDTEMQADHPLGDVLLEATETVCCLSMNVRDLLLVSNISGVTTMRVRFYSFLLAASLCGCATVQDYHYCLVQKYRADSAWKASYGILGHACSSDYQDGWKQGYYDISTGQCEEPPAVPPHKYWNASYQSLEGKAAVEDWYSGWQDGATAAVQDGNSYFHPIPASPTVPQGPVGPHMFHGGGDGAAPLMDIGPEKLPPAAPTHDLQPQVYVAPVPNKFESGDEEELLDESAVSETVDSEAADYEPLLEESGSEASVSDEEVGSDGYYAPAYTQEQTITDEVAE
jgi:hypothetical protein